MEFKKDKVFTTVLLISEQMMFQDVFLWDPLHLQEFVESLLKYWRHVHMQGYGLGEMIQVWRANVSNTQPTAWNCFSLPVCVTSSVSIAFWHRSFENAPPPPRFPMISNVSLTIGSCFSWNILSNGYGRRGDVSRGQLWVISCRNSMKPSLVFWSHEQCLRKPLMCWKRKKKLDRYSTQENGLKICNHICNDIGKH